MRRRISAGRQSCTICYQSSRHGGESREITPIAASSMMLIVTQPSRFSSSIERNLCPAICDTLWKLTQNRSLLVSTVAHHRRRFTRPQILRIHIHCDRTTKRLEAEFTAEVFLGAVGGHEDPFDTRIPQ